MKKEKRQEKYEEKKIKINQSGREERKQKKS